MGTVLSTGVILTVNAGAAPFTYVCDVHPAMTGVIDVPAICDSNPCQNGGSCSPVVSTNTYQCDCTGTGFQGDLCEQLSNEGLLSHWRFNEGTGN